MASWNLYDTFRKNQIGGVGADITAGTIKIALVTSAYTVDQNLHDFWNDVSANEVSGSNYTAGGNACASQTNTMSGAGLVTYDANDPTTWSQHATGFSNARRAIIYKDTGVSSTSTLIAYSDDFGADKGNVAGDLSITLDAAGIFTSAR